MQHWHLLKMLVAFYGFIQLYYHYIKKYIFSRAPKWAIASGLTRHYTLTVATGAVQFMAIVLTHVIVCISLCAMTGIQPPFTPVLPLLSVLSCVLIGIGCVCVATLLCQCGMHIGKAFFPVTVPETEEGWWCVARAGWMRHHQHHRMILPCGLAFTMVLLQLAAEEIIFRVVMLQLLHDAGAVTAIILSTLYFMYMQTFHLPSFASAMFPVIGALVLGLVNAVLYTCDSSVMALLIVHMSYFIVAILL